MLKRVLFILLILIIIIIISYGVWVGRITKQGDVVWHSCYHPKYIGWFSIQSPPPLLLQCAYVDVPMDYANPDGRSFSLAITRLSSHSPLPMGELVLLNGGPGGHSLDMIGWLYADTYRDALKQHFNIIGIAQRGVRPSMPYVDCAGKDEQDVGGRAYVDACIAKTGVDVLAAISSRDAVRDLDTIRAKLGVSSWSMLSYSYGTKLVALYAIQYPNHLQAGVLDGVVDTSEDLYTILYNQQAGAQVVFDAFMARCYQNLTCPFAYDADANASFIALLGTIEKKKLKDKDGEVIDIASMLDIFEENMGYEDQWIALYDMFGELSNGRTDSYNLYKHFSEFNELSFTKDALIGINCADAAPVVRDRDAYIAQGKILDAQALYNNYKTWRDDEYLDACYYWPHHGTDDLAPKYIGDDIPDLLFISQQYDFATPFANARNMANRYNDMLIYTPSYGHTVSFMGQSDCVDAQVVAYLFNPKMRGGELRCD